MNSSFVAKLEHGCALSDKDRAKLDGLTNATRVVRAGQDIISEGESPNDVHLVMEGIACRYKILAKGNRHIMAFVAARRLLRSASRYLGRDDHSIGTLTECTLVEIPRAVIDDLTLNYPRITRALWWATLVDEAILQE